MVPNVLLVYLTSWQEYPIEGIRYKAILTAEKLCLSRKDYYRNTLAWLNNAGLVFNDCGKSLIRITQEGEARAQALISYPDNSTTRWRDTDK